MRTIEGAKFEVGQIVRRVLDHEDVLITGIDVRQHGDDDYWITVIKNDSKEMAEQWELEALSIKEELAFHRNEKR